jgi:hypothetical protein
MTRVIAAMFDLAVLAGVYFWVTAAPPDDDTPVQTDQNQ